MSTQSVFRKSFLFMSPGALLLAACFFGQEGGADGGSVGAAGVSVELQVLPAALAKPGAAQAVRPVDSADVRVSAAGLDTLRFGFGGSPQILSLLDLPPGSARRFDVRLYAGGKLLYAGNATTDLVTDRKNAVTVHCLPEFSRLTASVHVPADFPKTIAGGELRLWNAEGVYTASPVTAGELRNFRVEEIPGDRDYAVSIALWGTTGDTLAKGYKGDLRIPKGQNVALVLPLTLTFPQLALTMTVGDPRTTTLVLALPGGRRVPSAFGDAVFTEVYPIPTTEEGGDNGEWLELFNRSADTLDLAGCQLVRDAGTGTGMYLALPAGTVVAPGRTLVVGRSAVSFAQVTQTGGLTLTNTSARLEFACGGVKMDTLRYSVTTSDTLSARVATGKAASLKPSRLGKRTGADAWCLASSNPGAGEYVTTPGALAGGCGE